MLSNILIDLRVQVAGVESYFHALQVDRDPQGGLRKNTLVGRYVDRFEKRGGQWRIAQRTVVYDWIRQQAMTGQSDEQAFGVRQPKGARQPADPLYACPVYTLEATVDITRLRSAWPRGFGNINHSQ